MLTQKSRRLMKEVTTMKKSLLHASTASPQIETEDFVELQRPWVVVVWNDPINLMSYVSFVFQKLFGYSKEKANELMMEVHNKGKSAVSQGTREKAELDVFRLHQHGLWATLQQD